MKMIYNRQKKCMEKEEQYGEKYLKFLYHTLLGRILLKIIIQPFFSKIMAIYYQSSFSKKKVKRVIETYQINMSEFEKSDYQSFHEFFIRKKKQISFNKASNVLISPADSKLMVYKITKDLRIPIKQSSYTLKELLEDNTDWSEYKDGNCLVFRLSIDDYHRYCYIDDGKSRKVKTIKGCLHTVSSISENEKVYSQNTRVCNYMETKNFGDLIWIEIGALLVGKIKNHSKEQYQKGEEKGYFELGGSTIVIVTKDNIQIDNDILEYSKKQIETKVKYGEEIGKLRC